MVGMLKSKRVLLREMEEEDWVGVHHYASQEKVCRYQPWGPNTEQDSKEFVMQVLRDAAKDNRERFVFAILLRENGKMIGAGEITKQDHTNRVGEIGYIIHPAYWGSGYATETANALLTFGFRQFKFHRIFATCDPRNIGSSRVLEKVGMTLEGRLREDILLRDGWRDSLLYSVLEQEWK